jgi:hypothetical protein
LWYCVSLKRRLTSESAYPDLCVGIIIILAELEIIFRLSEPDGILCLAKGLTLLFLLFGGSSAVITSLLMSLFRSIHTFVCIRVSMFIIILKWNYATICRETTYIGNAIPHFASHP